MTLRLFKVSTYGTLKAFALRLRKLPRGLTPYGTKLSDSNMIDTERPCSASNCLCSEHMPFVQCLVHAYEPGHEHKGGRTHFAACYGRCHLSGKWSSHLELAVSKSTDMGRLRSSAMLCSGGERKSYLKQG